MSRTVSIYGPATPLALYEGNLRRLLLLWPGLRFAAEDEKLSIGAGITLSISEQHKYTTVVKLERWINVSRHVRHLEMELRVCHDASLVEVSGYQGQSPIHSCVAYPNRQMRHFDEKKQVNLLLREVLDSVLKERKVTRLSPV